MTGIPIILVAAAAIVDVDGRVLIGQRPPGKALAGLWEFPGGKVEAGERPEMALIRELGEELGIELGNKDGVLEGNKLGPCEGCLCATEWRDGQEKKIVSDRDIKC